MDRTILAIGAAGCLVGCFNEPVDPTVSGAFACQSGLVSTAESEGPACPDSQACVNGRCLAMGDVPQVDIVFGEDPVVVRMAIPANLRLVGNLRLADPDQNAEHVQGEGHIVVTVDGQPQVTLTEGDLAQGVMALINYDNRPGAHRVGARAIRNDGMPYDNPGALGTKLLWVDDDRPHVAIARPWPGVRLSNAQQTVEVVLESINFKFIVPRPGLMDMTEEGHAHVHYDSAVPFPMCTADPSCDAVYQSIAPCGGSPPTFACTVMAPPSFRAVEPTPLPATGIGPGRLTAILRENTHRPLDARCHVVDDMGGETTGGPDTTTGGVDGPCMEAPPSEFVVDEIIIERVDPDAL